MSHHLSNMVEAALLHDHRWLPLEPNSSNYWGVTADSRMKVYRAAVSAQVQTKDPKHVPKVTQELLKAKKWDVLQWPSQSADLKRARLLIARDSAKCSYRKHNFEA